MERLRTMLQRKGARPQAIAPQPARDELAQRSREVTQALASLDLLALSAQASALQQHSQSGQRLPAELAAVARWRIAPMRPQMYGELLAYRQMPTEAMRTVRWLAAMQGPQQPIFATLRQARRAAHQELRLSAKPGSYATLQESTLASISHQQTTDILTITVGHPWQKADDVWMTFHGREPGGFGYGVHMMFSACDAALFQFWNNDGQRVGEQTSNFLGRLKDGCAEGKSDEALQALKAASTELDLFADVAEKWQRVATTADKKAVYSEIMSEHVRAFGAQAWRDFAASLGLPTHFKSESLTAILESDPRWLREFYNTDILMLHLRRIGGRILDLPADDIDRLLQEQVHIFCSIEPGPDRTEKALETCALSRESW